MPTRSSATYRNARSLSADRPHLHAPASSLLGRLQAGHGEVHRSPLQLEPVEHVHVVGPRGVSYNMDGSEQQVVADAPRPNNVDVLYGFKLEGRTVDLAVASLQASKKRGTRGVKVWAIDATTR